MTLNNYTSIKYENSFLNNIILIFFLSGFSSLIYQVVWQRALTLYFGVGTISVTIIVSVFMLGLGVGSILGGWLVEKYKRPIVLYVIIELLLGIIGAISLTVFHYSIPLLANASYTSGMLIIFLLLVLPTMLMGATLPVVLKIFNNINQDLENSLSILYFINTLGAAVGALLGIWLLISAYSLSFAVYTAAAINIFLVIYVCVLAWRSKQDNIFISKAKDGSSIISGNYDLHKTKYLPFAIFVTGFLAIGYQIVWFRFLSVFLKPSSYLFSSLLFIYLLGIAIGSLYMNKYLSRQKHDAKYLINTFFKINFLIALIQLLTWLLIYWCLNNEILYKLFEFTINTRIHPPINLFDNLWLSLSIFVWPALIVIPSTILMGASFPLIMGLAVKDKSREGWSIGKLYTVNVLGNMIGGLLTGFVLLQVIGTEATLLLFVTIGLAWLIGVGRYSNKSLKKYIIIVCVFYVLGLFVFPGKFELYKHIHPSSGSVLANAENTEGIKTIFSEGHDAVVYSYHSKIQDIDAVQVFINGQRHGGEVYTAYYERAIEAARWSSNFKNILVIGYGGGYVTKTLLASSEIEKITVVELSETLMTNLRQVDHISKDLLDSRVELVIEDGRRYLHRTEMKFDLIIMDPIRSTTTNSNNLYSIEFFDLASKHLTDNGVMFVWFNEQNIIPNTFAKIFPNIRYYKKYLIGSHGDLMLNRARGNELLSAIPLSLRHKVDNWLVSSPEYIGDKLDLLSLVNESRVNTDLDPNSEFYLHR